MDPVRLNAIRGVEGLGGRNDAKSKAAVAREFEALLVGEMMKSANRPVLGDSQLTGGSAGQMWRDLFLEQVIRAGAGSFGLVDPTLDAMNSQPTAPTEPSSAPAQKSAHVADPEAAPPKENP